MNYSTVAKKDNGPHNPQLEAISRPNNYQTKHNSVDPSSIAANNEALRQQSITDSAKRRSSQEEMRRNHNQS